MVSINTNLSAISASSQLSKASKSLSKSSETMTTGSRIINAADDVAGLAISQKMLTSKKVLDSAKNNAYQGQALLSIAEAALQEISSIVTRQLELASQSTSGSNSDNERSLLNLEFSQLKDEINRVATTTNFNGIKLLDNSISGAAVVTTSAPDSYTDFVAVGNFNDSIVSALSIGTSFTNEALLDKMPTVTAQYKGTANAVLYQVKIGEKNYTFDESAAHTNTSIVLSYNGSTTDQITLTVSAGAVNSQSDVDDKASKINEALKTISMYHTRDVSSYKAQGKITANGQEIGDLTGSSFSHESNNFTNVKLEGFTATAPKTDNGSAELSVMINGNRFSAEVSGGQIGANSTVVLVNESNQNEKFTYTNGSSIIKITNNSEAAAVTKKFSESLGLDKGSGLKFQVGLQASETLDVKIAGATTDQLFTDADGAMVDLSVASSEDATKAMDILQSASNKLSTTLANVGALFSRMTVSIKVNDATTIKLTESISLYRDADFSTESTNYSLADVKSQASTQMVAKANQQPQQLLKLLQ